MWRKNYIVSIGRVTKHSQFWLDRDLKKHIDAIHLNIMSYYCMLLQFCIYPLFEQTQANTLRGNHATHTPVNKRRNNLESVPNISKVVSLDGVEKYIYTICRQSFSHKSNSRYHIACGDVRESYMYILR